MISAMISQLMYLTKVQDARVDASDKSGSLLTRYCNKITYYSRCLRTFSRVAICRDGFYR
jgi:hypothetical protein